MKPARRLQALDDFKVYAPTAQQLARVHAYERGAAEKLTKNQLALSGTCCINAASIMIETLFFKFTGAPESKYIFSKMAMESWWRYGQGIWELIAAGLPADSALGVARRVADARCHGRGHPEPPDRA